jgi:hypothetical protein
MMLDDKWLEEIDGPTQLYKKVKAAHDIKILVQQWVDTQGHHKCWYYPEIFTEIARILDIDISKMPKLPPKEEFKVGCERYQEEVYDRIKGNRSR